MANRMVIMVGVAGSGKSTIASSLGYTVVSMDNLRNLGKGQCKKIAESLSNQDHSLSVWRRAENALVEEALKHGDDIVIDDTNLERWIRLAHIRRAGRYGYRVDCIFVDRPKSAYGQNASRERRVPRKAIDSHRRKLERPCMEEGYESMRVIFEPEMQA